MCNVLLCVSSRTVYKSETLKYAFCSGSIDTKKEKGNSVYFVLVGSIHISQEKS